ncbi:MAG: hypothetical protein H7336_10490 [Bacteriovorax sp.]|nr:hypothetical protein [Bacteriovorax sp.]
MKNLFLTSILILTIAHAFAGDFTEPTKHSKNYLVVGVSGFKTGRDKDDIENIYSNKIGKDSEDSGVWTNIITSHPKIIKTLYLSHYSKDSELDSVMKLVVDANDKCKIDQGLIIMVNSWGAKVSQRLAARYLTKCGILPHLTILIDGVSRPTPFAYDKPILSLNCVNFFQRSSKLQGTSIENCHNIELKYGDGKTDLFNAHIHAEWDASAKGSLIIQDYLNGKLPVMFLRDQYGIDYRKGL